jgi:hypothetical protein
MRKVRIEEEGWKGTDCGVVSGAGMRGTYEDNTIQYSTVQDSTEQGSTVHGRTRSIADGQREIKMHKANTTNHK